MTIFLATETASIRLWTAGLDAVSAVLGMAGTYFMAKRYANSFVSGLLFALLGMFLYLMGRGAQVRRFYSTAEAGRKDITDPAGDVALGLNLLFVAFLLQLGRIVVSYFFGKN